MKVMKHYVKSSEIRIGLLPLLLAGGISSGIVQAQSVWDGGGADNDWTTAANWVGDLAPVSATTTDVQFAGSTRLNPSLASGFSVKSLKFNSGSGAFTLGGSPISVQGVGNADSAVITNSSTSLQTIGNNINLVSGTFQAGAGGMVLNGNLAISGGVRFTGNNTINGVISGATTGNFMAFNGTVRLNSINTYSGSTQVFGGTVFLGQDVLTTSGAFGVTNGETAMGAAGASTLLISGSHQMARSIRLASAATTTTIGGESAAVSTFSGAVTLGQNNGVAKALTVTSASGGRVNITGNIVRATGATGSTDNLTKTGAGIVSLNGAANTYSGTTSVNAGTLLVNGSLAAGGGTVTVASSASLGGSGTINRDVSVSGGAIFTPGDFDASGVSQAGTLAVVGSLTFADTSVMNFDLGSASDLVAVTGNLTLDGVLNINAGAGFASGSYQLFSYTGTFINNTVSFGTLPSNFNYALDFSTANEVNLLVTSSIPEPANIGLILGGLCLVALVTARRGRSS